MMLCKSLSSLGSFYLGKRAGGFFVGIVGFLFVFKENLHTRGNSRPVYSVSM